MSNRIIKLISSLGSAGTDGAVGTFTGSGSEGQHVVNGTSNKGQAQLQTMLTAGAISTFALTVQGRAAPEANWVTLVSLTEASALVNGTRRDAVNVMPFMRAYLTAVGAGGATFSVWLDVT